MLIFQSRSRRGTGREGGGALFPQTWFEDKKVILRLKKVKLINAVNSRESNLGLGRKREGTALPGSGKERGGDTVIG